MNTVMKATMAFVALLAIGIHVQADDVIPPPWRDLTDPYSTLQEWTFSSPAGPGGVFIADNSTLPESKTGDGFDSTSPIPGAPCAVIVNMTWLGPGILLSNNPNGQPSPNEGGVITLFIPNWVDSEPLKLFQIQMTFTGDPSTPPAISDMWGYDSDTDTVMDGVLMDEGVITLDATNGIHLRHEYWTMMPNPDYEQVVIHVPFGLVLNQIVVDTVSTIPEPATASLLGLGGLLLLRRRR